MRVLATLMGISFALSAGAYEYVVQPLPQPPVSYQSPNTRWNDSDDLGFVIGSVRPYQNESIAFVYNGNGFAFFSFPGTNRTYGEFINDRGNFAGWFDDPLDDNQGFVNIGGAYRRISQPGGYASVEAFNEQDTCAGGYLIAVVGVVPYAMISGQVHIVTIPQNAEEGYFYGLNNLNVAIGRYRYDFNTTATTFSWTLAGGIVERPHGITLTDVNDLNEFIGHYYENNHEQAFIEIGGVRTNIGPGSPRLINNRHEVLIDYQSQFHLWRNGQRIDLRQLVDPAFGIPDRWFVQDLNDNGTMLAVATFGNQNVNVILHPVPEPATFLVLAGGLGAAISRSRKR